MNHRFVECLACPDCGHRLSAGDSTTELMCERGHRWPISGGVWRLITADARQDKVALQVRRRFEFQWKKWGNEERLFGQTDAEMAARLYGPYTDGVLDAAFYADKLVLDAGCGHGRYLSGFAGLGADVIGLDFGSGVDDAARRTGHLTAVQCVQGDVSKPPFQSSTFDLVFCFGVIPFTREPHETFARLAQLVRPGGYLYIWVYPTGSRLWEFTQRAIRSVTTRLPDSLLYSLCFVPVPLLGFAPTYSGTSLRNSTWRQCAQVVWDWYSPRYQWHFRNEEIQQWYGAAGFEPPVFLEVKLGAIGRRRAV